MKVVQREVGDVEEDEVQWKMKELAEIRSWSEEGSKVWRGRVRSSGVTRPDLGCLQGEIERKYPLTSTD